MSRAQAAAAEVTDNENIIRAAHLNRLYLRNDTIIQKTSKEFEELVRSNSSGSSSSNLHDLILLNIHKLKYSTDLLNKINATSTTIANHLNACQQLRVKLLDRETPSLAMSNPRVVNINRNGPAGNTALNVGELYRQPGSSVQAQSGVARNTGWVGGSKTTQVGGRDAYPLPIRSKLYVDAVTQVNPLTPVNNPEFYKNLEKAILDKTIQPEPVTISSSGSYHPTSQKPTHKTVKGRAGDKGGNKVTTRKHHHRHPTIHNVGHTVKVAHKPTDVNTIKTRRNHHAVKT
jgi:hypothetical protein